MIEMVIGDEWFTYAEVPRGKEWLRLHRPTLHEWIVQSVSGEWEFIARLRTVEYDSIYGEYRLIIAYENEDDAFLHRLRW